MADAHLLRSLDVAALEAEAAIRRDENDAAGDLARSLRQGETLRETLRRWRSFEVFVAGRAFHVSELGRDHVVVRGEGVALIPLRSLDSVRRSEGAPAVITDVDLIARLRSAARREIVVDVKGRGRPGPATGVLIQASPDHIVVRAEGVELAVPLGAVEVVRLQGIGDVEVGG